VNSSFVTRSTEPSAHSTRVVTTFTSRTSNAVRQYHQGRSGLNHLRILADATGIDYRRVDEMLEQVGLTGGPQDAGYPTGRRYLGLVLADQAEEDLQRG
jgi:hypothetical protein